MSASIDLKNIKKIIKMFEKHEEELGSYNINMYGEFSYSGDNQNLIKDLEANCLGNWEGEGLDREFRVRL